MNMSLWEIVTLCGIFSILLTKLQIDNENNCTGNDNFRDYLEMLNISVMLFLIQMKYHV